MVLLFKQFEGKEEMIKTKNDELLTKKEAWKYLRISSQTLENLMRQKQISFIKLDRKVLFKKADIDKFIESKRTPAKSEIP